EEMEEQTREAITAFVAETLGSSATVTTSVLRGPAAGALLQTVTPESVLVLGLRGLGGFKGLLLGSVSQECVEYASCPVVVVRTDRVLGKGDTVLVGTDGSDGAQRALAWAHALARATGAHVRALHAWRATSSGRPQSADAARGWAQQVASDIDSEEMEGDPR